MQILGTWLTDTGAIIRQKGCFVALLIATAIGSAVAQNVCINPVAQGGFTLEKTRLCVGTPVRITSVPTSVSNVGYNFQYNGNGFPATTVNVSTFTYTQPGSYTIIQVGSGGGLSTGTVACQQVEVLPVGVVRATARSCANRIVTLLATLDESNNKYDAYQVNWGDGVVQSYTLAQLQARPQHTYADTRNRTATIQGVYSAPASCGSTPFSISITPLANAATATAPIITRLTTVDDNNITINYQGNTNAVVQLLQRDGAGNFVPTSQTGVAAGTFSVQGNTRQTQCFQLASQDECGTIGPTSEQVCSMALTVQAISKQNNLIWEAYQGTTPFRYYRITRGGSPLGGTITNKSTATYADNNSIQCGVQYCYTIEVTAGPTLVTSAPTCATGVNTEAPDSFTNVLVSIENDKPKLIATLPASSTSYTMIVSRSSGSGPFQQVGALSANAFVDDTADPNAGGYCYQVAYQNTCGQVSAPSPTVCTVWLSSQSPGGIDWTRESPFSSGDVGSYTVEVINTDNGTRREIQAGTNTHYEPDSNDPVTGVQRYRVIATSAQGVVSYSNFYTLRRPAVILVPDAFTPNGDQANDVFLVKGSTTDLFRLIVYSRWGEPVFTSTDMTKGWDGTINGQPALEGQYMYRIETEDSEGKKTVRTGGVLLLR